MPIKELLWDLLYVCGQCNVSSSNRTVLVALALHADIDGTVRVSLRGVARHLNQSSGTIARHVGQLVELGLIEELGGDRTDNRRRIWRIPAMDQRDDAQILPLRRVEPSAAEVESDESGAVS